MNAARPDLASNAPDVQVDIEQSRLFNADLAPVPPQRGASGAC